MSDVAFDYYAQRLEQKIIIHLAAMKGVDVSVAMDWYYRSRLADQISRNEYDMAFLDSKYLARDLMENEPELFRHGFVSRPLAPFGAIVYNFAVP